MKQEAAARKAEGQRKRRNEIAEEKKRKAEREAEREAEAAAAAAAAEAAAEAKAEAEAMAEAEAEAKAAAKAEAEAAAVLEAKTKAAVAEAVAEAVAADAELVTVAAPGPSSASPDHLSTGPSTPPLAPISQGPHVGEFDDRHLGGGLGGGAIGSSGPGDGLEIEPNDAQTRFGVWVTGAEVASDRHNFAGVSYLTLTCMERLRVDPWNGPGAREHQGAKGWQVLGEGVCMATV